MLFNTIKIDINSYNTVVFIQYAFILQMFKDDM